MPLKNCHVVNPCNIVLLYRFFSCIIQLAAWIVDVFGMNLSLLSLLFNRVPEVVAPLTKDLKQSQYVNTSYNGSAKEPQQKKKRGRTRRANNDNYDADYTTGGESCDELDENWDRYWLLHLFSCGIALMTSEVYRRF